jgi:hypothetical protein
MGLLEYGHVKGVLWMIVGEAFGRYETSWARA